MVFRKKLYDPSDPRDAEELLNYLEELNSDDEIYDEIQACDQLDLILLPPIDGQDSDQDDAVSDDEQDHGIHTIGKGVLKQPMEVVMVNNSKEKTDIHQGNRNRSPVAEVGERSVLSANDSSDEEDNIPLAKRFKITSKNVTVTKPEKQKLTKLKKNIWEEEILIPRQTRIKIDKTPAPGFIQKIKDEKLDPIDLFKTFFPEDFIQFVCKESQKYAVFKGKHDFTVTTHEMYVYFAILLLSGYCKVPFRRLYWETKADTFNCLISNSMARDRFETIHRFLHFNDNTKIDADNRTYKIQPLIDRVNQISQELAEPLGLNFSLDEAMEPYFGKHNMKQFIRGKPIRYGFKFWCLTSPEGYILKFSPYCGSGDKTEGKTLGSSVTEKLCLNYVPKNSTIYLDNFFNSLPLLRQLKGENINCIGTIRSDRIEKAPLKDLRKEDRGSAHVLRNKEDQLILIRWHDNSQVTIGTNVSEEDTCLTKGHCKRWSKQKRKHVEVDQPTIVDLYNQGMGGVDLFDKMRGLYRIRIRSRKWYWPFIRFCLNSAIVNMWQLYRFSDPKINLLNFVRRIVLSILTAPNYLAGPKPKCSRTVLKEVRYDKLEHYIDKQNTQRRCAYCGKCTKFSCIKYNVGLHPDMCFRVYHTSKM